MCKKKISRHVILYTQLCAFASLDSHTCDSFCLELYQLLWNMEYGKYLKFYLKWHVFSEVLFLSSIILVPVMS